MTNNWNYGDSYFNGDSYKTRAQAFAAARKNGSGIFTYKGKQYNTMQKGENADEFRRAHADYDYFLGNVAKDQGGWKPSDPVQTSYKVNKVPDAYTKPQTLVRTKLSMFTNDDIRNLGFRNYAGMVSAIGNQANANNNFVKAMIDRYGSDTSKWNQNTIENDLGIKGTYRSFGRGDFGDMSRSMAEWIGQNNGEIDKQDLQSRTGSDGVVYANSKVKDLFDKVQLKPKTFTFNVNLLGTPKKQQGGQLNMDEQLQQEFLQYLMQKTGAQNKQQLEQEIQQLGEDGLKREYVKFIQEIQQQGVQTAMNGAKLNYINKLNSKCPQGTHLSYYRIGGTLCKKCEANAYNESSDPIKAFKQKCGGKVKKAAKQKCGGKVKKKELGGEIDNKKNQPKSKLVKKPQNKIIPKKPQNPRPGPKDLKKLPNGKYPKYWTADQRGQWDRDHDEGV